MTKICSLCLTTFHTCRFFQAILIGGFHFGHLGRVLWVTKILNFICWTTWTLDLTHDILWFISRSNQIARVMNQISFFVSSEWPKLKQILSFSLECKKKFKILVTQSARSKWPKFWTFFNTLRNTLGFLDFGHWNRTLSVTKILTFF